MRVVIPRSPGKELKMFPLSDLVWSMFFRGIGLGFLGGFVLIALFFLTGGKLTPLTWARPSGLLYFLAGLEIGIGLAVGLVFLVFHNMQGGGPRMQAWAQRMLDQS